MVPKLTGFNIFTLKNVRAYQDLNAGPILGKIFKFRIQDAQDINLQLWVQILFKSVKRLRLGSVRRK